MNKTLKSLLVAPLIVGSMVLTSPVFAEKQEITIQDVLNIVKSKTSTGELYFVGTSTKNKDGSRYAIYQMDQNKDGNPELIVTYQIHYKEDSETIETEPNAIFYNFFDQKTWDTNKGDVSIFKDKDGVYRKTIFVAGSKFS